MVLFELASDLCPEKTAIKSCVNTSYVAMFRVVYSGISHKSDVFSWYTHERLGEKLHVTSDK